jgi:hypothetical protein
MKRYKEILGEEFIRDKVYYDMEGASADEIYNSFITLPQSELKKYDGINGFDETAFEQYDAFFKKTFVTEKKQVFTKVEDGKVKVYPGWYFFKDGFEMSKLTSFNALFDMDIKNKVAGEDGEDGAKSSATVVPAELAEDNNIYYRVKKKGMIEFTNIVS